MSDGVAGAGSGERGADATTLVRDEEERKKRLFLWLWFAVGLLLLVLLFVVCAGDGEDEPVALTTTTTTTTTAAPAAAPTPATAPTTASVAPIATPAPTTATPPPAPTPTEPTTTTEAGPIDVSGEWTFMIDVTETRGACAGEENEPVGQETVTISQDGDILTVTGLNGTDPPWQGQIVDNTVTFQGERDEDGGRTVAFFALTVDDDGTRLTGIEEWTWSGPGGNCPDSLSTVTAERA